MYGRHTSLDVALPERNFFVFYCEFDTVVVPFVTYTIQNTSSLLKLEIKSFSFSNCNYADQIKPVDPTYTDRNIVHGCLIENSGF